jgi:hypothetical protein
VRGLTALPHYRDARAYAHADARAMDQAHTGMLEVFQRFPHVDFVVKMHPAERLDIYLEYMERCRARGLRNVVLVNREYIGDVLNASSLHIHRYCTTGIEAWMMGVPTISLHSADWHLDASSGGAGGEGALYDQLVSSIDDISHWVDYYVGGGRPSADQQAGRDRHLRRWLFRVDGHCSSRQAALLAPLAAERRGSVRLRPLAFGRSLRGAARGTITMAANGVMRRPFDAPLTWRSGQPAVNELGYIDRVTRQPDVERWCAALRPGVRIAPTLSVAIGEEAMATRGVQ